MIDAALESDLCAACGLCCSGALFVRVPLAEDEIERAERLGLGRTADEEPCFPLPCAALECRQCSIYPDRPAVCANYRCEVLIAQDKGEITTQRAREIIDEAVKLVAEAGTDPLRDIGAMIRDAYNSPKAWREGDRAGLARRANQQLTLMALARHLNTYFRENKAKN